MKNFYLYILAIVLIPVLANVYGFARLSPIYMAMTDQYVAESMRQFAAQVEDGDMTHSEISNRLNKIANGEEKIEKALRGIRLASIIWLFSVSLLALLQAMFIIKLLKIHNKSSKSDAVTGAPS